MKVSILDDPTNHEGFEWQCSCCNWVGSGDQDCDCNPDPCPTCGIWLRWQETLPGGYCQYCWFCENCDDVRCPGCGD